MSRPNRSCAFASIARLWLRRGAALLVLAGAANAGELYQWKDAGGVTHYSDSPPTGQTYKNRTFRDNGVAAAPAEPAESAQCTTARMNLKHLKGNQPAGFDADGDGRPDATFDAAERTEQTREAEAVVARVCAATVAADTES